MSNRGRETENEHQRRERLTFRPESAPTLLDVSPEGSLSGMRHEEHSMGELQKVLLKRTKKNHGRISWYFTKNLSFKTLDGSDVGAISQSFISWVFFPPPVPPPPPTCVCIRMEYLGPRLPYILLSSNAHCTTKCTNVHVKDWRIILYALHSTMWIWMLVTKAVCWKESAKSWPNASKAVYGHSLSIKEIITD